MNLTARLTAIATSILLFIRPAPKVEDIVAQLESTHGRLMDARERQNAEAKRAEEKAAVLIRKAIAHRAEAGRAHRVGGRLSDLLS